MQPNSLSLLNIPRPMTNPCGRRTIQTKGCDWIQEFAISVQRSKPTSIPHERFEKPVEAEIKKKKNQRIK
jgi:hypothetical protein